MPRVFCMTVVPLKVSRLRLVLPTHDAPEIPQVPTLYAVCAGMVIMQSTNFWPIERLNGLHANAVSAGGVGGNGIGGDGLGLGLGLGG